MLSRLSIVRIGLVQLCRGAIVMLTTSTLNRRMVVEVALPGLLVGLAATAAQAFLASGHVRDLKLARKLFMKQHGMVLRSMQDACYKSDERPDRFVSLCHDVDVQRLTFEAYMNKKLVRARPMAHIKIGIKTLAHLLRLVPTEYT